MLPNNQLSLFASPTVVLTRHSGQRVRFTGQILGTFGDGVVCRLQGYLPSQPCKTKFFCNVRRAQQLEDALKAYLIDPFTQTITETDFNGDYRHIYTLIDAGTFDVVAIGNGDGIYIDDEGLLSEPEGGQKYFQLQGYAQPIGGKGLVLGSDEEGESVSPQITLEALRGLITFPDVEFKGFTPPQQYEGPGGFVIDMGRPIFGPPKKEKE